MILTPTPGDKVHAGHDLTPWIVGEIREKPYPHANLHRNLQGRVQTKTGVPLAELAVVIPYEARPEPKWLPEEVPTESEVEA